MFIESKPATTFIIRQSKKAYIAVKAIGGQDLRIVWARDKKYAAEFSSKKNAEEFIFNHHLLNAEVIASKP